MGFYKLFNKFVIGVMIVEVMECYIDVGNLLIVGNRVSVYEFVLKCGVVVLIIGGFDMDDEVKWLVDEKELFILLILYDMFIVVMMINCVIYV